MNELISVIVPIYNVEKYLERCVKSICNQTYTNLEIILVDDGSPDSCPLICDNFAKYDKRIKVIHKKNGGLSDARNAGMVHATGEFYCFVDSDDYIENAMIEKLKKAIDETKATMAIANFKTVDEEGKRVISAEDSPIINGVYTATELLPRLYQQLGWYYIVAWNKLYHKSLFEDIKFPFGKIHEDEYVVGQIMWKAQKIACISYEGYVYTYLRKGSIMSSKQALGQLHWLESLYLRYKYFENQESVSEFVRETRAVYFRELNNMFLEKGIRENLTFEQLKLAKKYYSEMNGKTKTERINWILFNISPRLEKYIVQLVRNKGRHLR